MPSELSSPTKLLPLSLDARIPEKGELKLTYEIGPTIHGYINRIFIT